jgi:hypothetical protein
LSVLRQGIPDALVDLQARDVGHLHEQVLKATEQEHSVRTHLRVFRHDHYSLKEGIDFFSKSCQNS